MRKNMYRNIKGKKVHVNFLASQSRTHTVKNCTIPKADPKSVIDIKLPWGTVKGTKWEGWTIPEGGFKQFKSMMKKHTEWIYDKKDHITRKVVVPSTFPTKSFDDYQKKLWKNLGPAAKMEAYTQDKLKKWERKHPRPCETDDLFKEEFIPLREKEREEALERIRDFVVSMFDKLPLTGRFKMSEKNAVYQEKKIADIKDINGDGHKVNELGPKSKLLNKAQKITNKTHAKNPSLVAANLKDHKRKKGRMILPQAA